MHLILKAVGYLLAGYIGLTILWNGIRLPCHWVIYKIFPDKPLDDFPDDFISDWTNSINKDK
jgi:hypothetical protein